MSRSRRKTPVMGMTTARSEKQDKQLANRRMRREPISELDPDKRDYGSSWDFGKDGKQRFDPTDPDLAKYMRK